jgi:hypothetical protein
MTTNTSVSRPALWTGRILKGIISLFLIFDAAMKIFQHPQAVAGTKLLGLPEDCLLFLGLYLFLSTVLFLIPRTALLGAVFITAYLGGAVAITYAAKMPGHPYLFAVVFAIVLWVSEFLQNNKVRDVFPWVK